MHLGISGFEPVYEVGLDAVRRAHGSRLAALVGRRLTGFAVVRFVEDGDWYADCPVVLDFDGVRVEICHSQLDLLSIGWDTIDVAAGLVGWEWFELTPEWSRCDARLEPFVGRELRETTLLDWRPADRRDLAAGTVAVEFAFGDEEGDGFRILNGLDENRIETGVAPPEYVRHPLTR
ncbi:hypothetical protein [Streptacidiphilus jiangxiensis]|uniref:Uncharacterized protein n=1 Tax=Streptacidiphilus jiangxiensis TaxID=235985 RepID=A0A1H7URK3_STRJI|nr:hypothetical protein [Streptacidiphilus jiangxiensis]SEL99399.1 hypothetical protein SAMN05414137_116114 [Streptacidiphilus jiangxiensis]